MSIAFLLKLDRRIQLADFRSSRCLKYEPRVRKDIIVKYVTVFLLFSVPLKAAAVKE